MVEEWLEEQNDLQGESFAIVGFSIVEPCSKAYVVIMTVFAIFYI